MGNKYVLLIVKYFISHSLLSLFIIISACLASSLFEMLLNMYVSTFTQTRMDVVAIKFLSHKAHFLVRVKALTYSYDNNSRESSKVYIKVENI